MDIESALIIFGPFSVFVIGAWFVKPFERGGWWGGVWFFLLMGSFLQCLAFGGLFLMTASFSSKCVVEPSVSLASPSGDKVAYIHGYDCGASTRYNVNVSVLPTDQRPEDRGNVFNASDLWSPRCSFDEVVRTRWDGSILIISYNPRQRVHWRQTSAGETQVRYLPWVERKGSKASCR